MKTVINVCLPIMLEVLNLCMYVHLYFRRNAHSPSFTNNKQLDLKKLIYVNLNKTLKVSKIADHKLNLL